MSMLISTHLEPPQSDRDPTMECTEWEEETEEGATIIELAEDRIS